VRAAKKAEIGGFFGILDSSRDPDVTHEAEEQQA
jgi:uncharacterized protein YjgD (DUF1641 family)